MRDLPVFKKWTMWEESLICLDEGVLCEKERRDWNVMK
jgi:hypothetical protein